MPSPQSILSLLLGGAIGAAGILQGMHWKATRAPVDQVALAKQLRDANQEIEILRRENESLRSLAQGGGELSVPRELIDRTEKEYGLHFLSNPVVHRIAGEELRDRISAAIESRMGPSGIDDRQESWLLIGWLRPDDDLLTQLAAVRATEADGWFDDVTGEGWMPDHADLNNIPEQASLLRLLARILFHQHFPPTPAYPGDDAARAREALHHGAAAGAEARFYAEMARTRGFMPMTENTQFKQLLASLSPFIRGVTRFPDTAGKGYADALFVQGNEALHAAFRSPPQTTHAILSPGLTAAPAPLELPAGIEDPFLTETAGRLGLALWLEPHAEAAEIAATWKNDRYSLFPDGDDSAAVLWDIELESAADIDRLEAVAGKSIPTQENRHISLTRVSPTRLRFLNTADAATAARFKK